MFKGFLANHKLRALDRKMECRMSEVENLGPNCLASCVACSNVIDDK